MISNRIIKSIMLELDELQKLQGNLHTHVKTHDYPYGYCMRSSRNYLSLRFSTTTKDVVQNNANESFSRESSSTNLLHSTMCLHALFSTHPEPHLSDKLIKLTHTQLGLAMSTLQEGNLGFSHIGRRTKETLRNLLTFHSLFPVQLHLPSV